MRREPPYSGFHHAENAADPIGSALVSAGCNAAAAIAAIMAVAAWALAPAPAGRVPAPMHFVGASR